MSSKTMQTRQQQLETPRVSNTVTPAVTNPVARAATTPAAYAATLDRAVVDKPPSASSEDFIKKEKKEKKEKKNDSGNESTSDSEWMTLLQEDIIIDVTSKAMYDSDEDEDANLREAEEKRNRWKNSPAGMAEAAQKMRFAKNGFCNHSLYEYLTALGFTFETWAEKCENAGGEEKALQEILAESSGKVIHRRTKQGETWETPKGTITWDKRVQQLEANKKHPQYEAARKFNAILVSYEEKIAEYLAEKRKIAENNERLERLFSPEVIGAIRKKFRDQFKFDRKFDIRQFMKKAIETLNVDNVYYCVLIMLNKWQVQTMFRNGKAVVDIRGFTAKGGRIESRNCETTYQRKLPTSLKDQFLAFNPAFSHGQLKDTKEILEKFIIEYLDMINGKNGRTRSFESRSARDMVSNRFMNLLKKKGATKLHRHLFVLFQEMTIVYAKEIDDMKRDELLQSQKTGKITGAVERMAIKNGGVKTLEDLGNLLAASAANEEMEVDPPQEGHFTVSKLPWDRLNEEAYDIESEDEEACDIESEDEEACAYEMTRQEKGDYDCAMRCQEVENSEEDFSFEDRKLTAEEQFLAEEVRVNASQEKEATRQRKRDEKAARQAANRDTNVAAAVVNAELNNLPSAPVLLTEEEVVIIEKTRSECKFFIKSGFCGRGAGCKFSHDGRESTDADKIIPVEKRQSCNFFARNGHCRHGKSCRHKHGNRLPQEGDEIQPRRPRQECQYFARNGHCGRGEKCNHLHGGRDPRPEDGTKRKKKQRKDQRD